jgi:acetyl-CoA acetyltransferase
MKSEDTYAIVGVGTTPQGRVKNRTTMSFYLEAGRNAIRDAGLNKNDIDGLILYRQYPPVAGEEEITPYAVAQQLGLMPTLLSQEANCARVHLHHAISAIEAGLCKHVLVVYADNTGLSSRSEFRASSERGIFGQFSPVGDYALAARRGMFEFGTGPETWAEIAVAQRMWAQLNPAAFMREKLMTHEDYFNTRYVVEPLRLADCCLISDGGRGYVVTTTDRAKDLKHPVVTVMGLGQHSPSTNVIQSEWMAGPTGAKNAGLTAMAMAGISHADIDACQIYDCFTYTVELTLQDLGFFGPGEGGDWMREAGIGPGGKMPVNTSGGQLSEAYFMGLTPLTEAVLQLMGRCGDRQLGEKTGTKEPEIILTTDNGAVLQTNSVAILRKY